MIKIPLKDWNLEANEELGMIKELKTLKTHYEIISMQTALTQDMAIAIRNLYEAQTKRKFEIREVAE